MISKRSAGMTRNMTVLVVGVVLFLLSTLAQVQSFVAVLTMPAATSLPVSFSPSTRRYCSSKGVGSWSSRQHHAHQDKRGSMLSVVSRTPREAGVNDARAGDVSKTGGGLVLYRVARTRVHCCV